MTNEEFKAGIDAIKGGTGHKFDDPNEVKAWFAVVGKCDGRSWKAAVMRCLISDQGGFPSPGRLRQYIDEFENGIEQSHDEAFANVIKAIRRFGHIQVREAIATFDANTRDAVEACGGFRSMCDMKTADRSFLKAQFRDAYNGAKEQRSTLRKLPESIRPRLQSEQNQKLIASTAKKIGVTE